MWSNGLRPIRRRIISLSYGTTARSLLWRVSGRV
uniref:Uncharacterized protein n=1 Tax=Brassica oleracea TaxID=3712 RepID=A0A3P6CEZ8_BRAOL|nr:unnamed protein product [Brassica oleracea]